MRLLPVVSKARKPKFELHLKIYELNNVPLVSGVSLIKWHLPHSIHGEHRGRTPKCPIANHRVEYGYGKVVPVRIAIDRNNNLAECPIEFEVLQEFSMAGGGGGAGRDEKITLGTVRLNISEYVEESEALMRQSGSAGRPSVSGAAGDRLHLRKTSSATSGGTATTGDESVSPKSSRPPELEDRSEVEDGVVRRYLMQESKINSTLKIGILMIQVDGERNFVAPPLKTAPVFGGIAGIMAGEQVEQDDAGQLPSISKSRDASELQDMYRRALAASWACHPGELSADECVEDIFAGGNGFRTASPPASRGHAHAHHHSRSGTGGLRSAGSGDGSGSGSGSGGLPRDDSGSASGDETDMMGTLRPRDAHRFRHHARQHSGGSEKSNSGATVVSTRGRSLGVGAEPGSGGAFHRRDHGKDDAVSSTHSRSESLTSLATTLGSERGRDGFKRAREVAEYEARDDLIAWQLPSTAS